jgi:serine/threonine-protein kinase
MAIPRPELSAPNTAETDPGVAQTDRPPPSAAASQGAAISVPAAKVPADLSSVQSSHHSRSCPTCGARYPADFMVCPRDATPLTDAPEGEDPMLGAVLSDSYQIVGVLGEGGMGKVYEARHRRLANKRYALKVLHHELSRQPDVVTRFQREAEAASALEHPNVVRVFDVNCTQDGRPYIVAEHLQGEQLGDYLDRVGKVSAGEAARLVRQVCRALAVAHARGIVHRDIKPENVFMVSEGGNVTMKVLDFGISKLDGAAGTNLTKTGMVMGTPGYIAPEQARGDRVDFRADIYATGAILYRAVTGKKPFDDLDPMAAITAVLVQEPPRPRSLDPSVPPAFELVIQRAMALAPSERYGSMTELEAALAPFEPVGGALIPAPAETLVSPASAPAEQRSSPRPKVVDTLALVTRNVRLARPTIALFTVLAIVFCLAVLADALAAGIRLFGGQNDLTSAEVVLCVIMAAVAVGMPAGLFTRYVARKVWSSTPRAIAMALRLRRTVVFSAAGYGAGALFVHVLQTLVQRQSLGVAWPGWNLVLFGIALLTGAVVWLTGGLAQEPR